MASDLFVLLEWPKVTKSLTLCEGHEDRAATGFNTVFDPGPQGRWAHHANAARYYGLRSGVVEQGFVALTKRQRLRILAPHDQ